jgi:hypothetical protein
MCFCYSQSILIARGVHAGHVDRNRPAPIRLANVQPLTTQKPFELGYAFLVSYLVHKIACNCAICGIYVRVSRIGHGFGIDLKEFVVHDGSVGEQFFQFYDYCKALIMSRERHKFVVAIKMSLKT